MIKMASVDKNLLKLSQAFQYISSSDSTNKVLAILNSDFDVNFAMPVDEQTQYYKTKQKLRGCTALHFAAKNRFGEKYIEVLLKRGADFNHKNHDGLTPLRLIFGKLEKHGFYKVFVSDYMSMINRLLLAHLEYNNTVNPHCNNGISHFHIACTVSNLKVAKFYLEAGVSANEAIYNSSKILPGYSPLHIAIRNRDKDMVHLLLEYGADYNCLDSNGMSPLHCLSDKSCNEDLLLKIGKQRKNKTVKNEGILDLISKPSTDNFNPLDHMGLTQLHIECIKRQNADTLDDLEELLKGNVDVNAAVNFDAPIWSGYTALHFAVDCSTRMVMLLLKYGADLMCKDAKEMTPLDLCLNIYEPSDISCILKNYSTMDTVRFQNGASLVEILRAFKSANTLRDYLKIIDVNTALPPNSPIWPGYTLLHLAVVLSRDSNNSKVKLCLKFGADVTIKNANNMTALHLAFQMKKKDCIKVMLDAHAKKSANPIDNNNVSHFHIACAAANIKAVNKFLADGINPDTPLQPYIRDFLKTYFYQEYTDTIKVGLTPLQNTMYNSLSKNCQNLVKLLIEFKADPHAVDADGFTWIQRSFFCTKSFSPATYYRSLWAHPDALKSNPVGPGGLSHLHVACFLGSKAAVKALLPLTKNINEPISREILKYVKCLPTCTYPISVGDTPLHLAVKGRMMENVTLLLENGAKIVKNADGFTPIHVALIRFRFDSPTILRQLLKKFIKSNNPDKVGMTPLHVACALQDISLTKKLLINGGDLNSRIDSNSPVFPDYTALEILMDKFASENKDDFLRVLVSHILKNVEDSNSRDQELHAMPKRRRKCTLKNDKQPINSKAVLFAFHYSCASSNSQAVETFIKYGVNVNAPRNYIVDSDAGYTPLHFAVKYGSENVIQVLLEHGADVTLEDSHGNSPLHLAAKCSPDRLEIFLRTCKADFGMKNAFGRTLLDLLQDNKQAQSNNFLSLLKNDSASNIDLPTKMRLVKNLIRRFSGQDFQSLIEHIPNISDIDTDSRNIFHNLALFANALTISFDEYVKNLEFLLKNGCELEGRDNSGKTPLHLAVFSKNSECIGAFLSIGADVNVYDFSGKTAYQSCCDLSTFDAINEHVCKIYHAGLYLNCMNKERCRKYFSDERMEKNNSVLFKMTRKRITTSFTLRDVLTERMVMKFPLIPRVKRQEIIKYVNSDYVHNKFSKWLPVFKMQIRKCFKRENLFKSAVILLHDLLDSRLPLHCIESILVNLSNDDLKTVCAQ